jgi:hypothetical protein
MAEADEVTTTQDTEHDAAYSITSSARDSTVFGMSRSIAFAVFRFTTSSYFVGDCTGWFLALENAIDVTGRATMLIAEIWPVRD